MAKTVVRITLNRFPEIARALPREAGEIVEETVIDIDTNIATGMAASHSGAWYGDHQASAPGEMPAIDTGALVNSIQTIVRGTEGAVYTNQEYAEFLEYGTVNMAARPYMTPAAESARGPFMKKLQRLESRL
jgi:phage gpG-like protein